MTPEARLAELKNALKKAMHSDWDMYDVPGPTWPLPGWIQKDFDLLEHPFAALEAVLAIPEAKMEIVEVRSYPLKEYDEVNSPDWVDGYNEALKDARFAATEVLGISLTGTELV